MELIGRDQELAALERAVEDVSGGAGRVVGLDGEAGIGKTELLGALAGYARPAGLLVLEGRCAEHERDVPFGVVIDALDEHVATLSPRRLETIGPELAAVLPAAAERPGATVSAEADAAARFRHHRALRALLELLARERPVALLLDDLHWADEASLEFVLHVLRRPPRAACLLTFALRPGERGARLLAAARATPGWEHLPLRPLSEEAARSLVAEVPDAAAREHVIGEAGGNPLFLRELGRLARQGETALPATLTAAVGLEVAALEPAMRALIAGAAVAGDPFDPELAAAAAGLEPDATVLDRLVAAELIRSVPHPPGRSFAFRHPLVRRVVYDGTPPAWRLDAHERAAAALARRGAAPAARAYHVARFARPGDDAAVALLTAAAETAARPSPAAAAHWYAAALRLLPHDDIDRRAALLAPMAGALASAGRLHAARAALVEALELMPDAPAARRLELVTSCARLEALVGDPARGRRRLLEALEAAPPAQRAVIALELAGTASCAAPARGNAKLRGWIDEAQRGADPVLLAGAEALAAVRALWSDHAAAAVASLDRAAARLRDIDDAALATRLSVTVQVGRSQLRLERYADAAATAERALSIARATHQDQTLVALLDVRAIALWQLLDLDGALREAETAEEIARFQGVPYMVQHTLWLRALIHHYRGETAEAERAAHESARLLRSAAPGSWTLHSRCVLAALREPHDCLREMQAAGGPRLERVEPSWSTWLLLALVRAAVAVGRVDDAERWADELGWRTARLVLPASAARATSARAEVLLARGAPAAAALAERAATTAGDSGARLDATEAGLLAGRALAAAGETARAKAILQRVAADAGRGRALRLRDAAARELRRLGTRVSAESRHAARGPHPDRLSPRERHVAELVAHGHSNKHIAATLFLSEKTIRNTLTRVYAKLGVRSRSQLTRTLTPR
jgi:DNA-binding CsgD family transcriptional regulator